VLCVGAADCYICTHDGIYHLRLWHRSFNRYDLTGGIDGMNVITRDNDFRSAGQGLSWSTPVYAFEIGILESVWVHNDQAASASTGEYLDSCGPGPTSPNYRDRRTAKSISGKIPKS
jgi:hypothetical protein